MEVTNFRVCPNSEFPRSHEVDTFDGFVVTGSRLINIGEGHTWIDPLLNFIRAHYRRHRFLGVCFGHQIIQAAVEGKVEARDAELIRFPVQLDEVGRKILNTSRDHLNVYLAHRYHVVESSPLLANFGTTPHCKSQFSCIPNHIITTQFHPEVDAKLMLETLTSYWPPAEDVREATMANFWD
ncbi:class I glutamine amidotransferase-like protein [Gonapodya prolifera JEL478]|uniref:Class I glutamine amidotransferase-like protein n=1 Tax=Gonapodya prolifera (strain JEL478) TaxID=1344416 RepID=A0A139AEB6_GONPJ|nr:class I glutamine amidotransferase-like protein [Gonapodya prolifera JEL478]|eukprot:KXS15019.1 class I glutamine amidotransferase-like protein [Gonapodya prolifera JEL478]